INRAEGEKRAQVLAAEAEKQQQILTAEGEAQAIIRVAEAQAAALQKIGNIAVTNEGSSAIQLELAQKAIAAKEAIAKESSVVLLPDGNTEAASVVAQVLSIADSLKK
ncbi:band-7 C-terminal domain-containing protein, partial [Oleiphilus sp. HI0066]|uniref:band-7 C-terminal domain-containing protein n=2 Tax=Oleiphilus TaxID=141450 RepID=UPI000A94E84A